jgi:urea transport system substrate-binding protein
MINGDSYAAFFQTLRKAGVSSTTIPTLSFSIAENEVRSLGVPMMVGDYAAWNYFESLDRPENRAFLGCFRAKFGPQPLNGDPTAAAYFGVRSGRRRSRPPGPS